MAGSNNLGRGWTNATHSDLSPRLKQSGEQSIVFSLLKILVSLTFVVLLSFARFMAKTVKALFNKLRA